MPQEKLRGRVGRVATKRSFKRSFLYISAQPTQKRRAQNATMERTFGVKIPAAAAPRATKHS